MQDSTRPLMVQIVLLVVALGLGLWWVYATQSRRGAVPAVATSSGAAYSLADAATADRLLLALGNLRGAVVDTKRGELVILGATHPVQGPVTAHDWATVLQCATAGESPAFSLDPLDQTKPQGPKLSCVYYGPIRNTRLGLIMFEADWLMKLMGLGKVRPMVAGFCDLFELSFARDSENTSPSQFLRFWITCEELRARTTAQTFWFEGLKLCVKTEKMHETAQGLASSGGNEDPVAREFAQFLTDHLDELAGQQPVYAELKRLAGLLALANWIVAQGGQLDPTWIETHATVTHPTPEIKPSSALTREHKEVKSQALKNGTQTKTLIRKITLRGGVDLKIPTPTAADDKELHRLQKLVTKYDEWVGEPVFRGADIVGVTAPMINLAPTP
jgi:hypothetical protein